MRIPIELVFNRKLSFPEVRAVPARVKTPFMVSERGVEIGRVEVEDGERRAEVSRRVCLRVWRVAVREVRSQVSSLDWRGNG